jgi:1,4-dihydroxy-2-naphthoyl-CoA hydrolase
MSDLLKTPFDEFYGLEIVRVAGGVEGRLTVASHHHQPTGVVHGGVYASVGEAVASGMANLGLAERGEVAMGMTNTTSFMRPVSNGVLRAVPEVLHRGRTTWLVDVRILHEQGQLVAVSRVTLAVRPRPDGV